MEPKCTKYGLIVIKIYSVIHYRSYYSHWFCSCSFRHHLYHVQETSTPIPPETAEPVTGETAMATIPAKCSTSSKGRCSCAITWLVPEGYRDPACFYCPQFTKHFGYTKGLKEHLEKHYGQTAKTYKYGMCDSPTIKICLTILEFSTQGISGISMVFVLKNCFIGNILKPTFGKY